jgi:hypothetical protein
VIPVVSLAVEHTKLMSSQRWIYACRDATHTLHPRGFPSLRRSSLAALWRIITCSTVSFNLFESNCALTLPVHPIGSQLDFSSNTAFINMLYSEIHSSTSISSRPSMMAISLFTSATPVTGVPAHTRLCSSRRSGRKLRMALPEVGWRFGVRDSVASRVLSRCRASRALELRRHRAITSRARFHLQDLALRRGPEPALAPSLSLVFRRR